MKCFKCDKTCHHVAECIGADTICFKCNKPRHHAAECKSEVMTIFNCGDPGHIRTQCQKPKKSQYDGKVSLSGTKTIRSDNLIRGMWSINGIPLIVFIDICVMHSFISLDCAKNLNLEISHMVGSMVIDTPTSGLVTTSLVCSNCALTIYGKDFGMYLFCLPLSHLDVILRMNWLDSTMFI